jgi:transketolase
LNKDKLESLIKTSINVRKICIKTQKIVGSGHLGGSFSSVELMVYLYFYKMNIDPKNPYKDDRDIFILSKGHASLGYYSILAERGYFEIDELKTYRQVNSRLQGHPHIDSAPGIECSSGSLGQGISFGIGLALGYKKRNMPNKIYVMTGDGELEEGQIWEAIMLQSFLKLDNLIIIIDHNQLQLDNFIDNITGLNPIKSKFECFGYNVVEINGNDFNEIDNAFSNISSKKPNIIIADTVKGKGISFMENKIEWHSKKVNEDEYIKSLKELEKQEESINE